MCLGLSNAGSYFTLHQEPDPEYLFSKAEDYKSVLHRRIDLNRFTPQQPFKFIIGEPVNSFRSMVSQNLDHSVVGFRYFPTLTKAFNPTWDTLSLAIGSTSMVFRRSHQLFLLLNR